MTDDRGVAGAGEQGALDSSGADGDPGGLGRSIAVGSATAGLLSFAVSASALHLAGVEVGAAVGFGLFVAFWGGLGFGSMTGGVLWAERHLHRSRAPGDPGPDDTRDDTSDAGDL